MKTITLHELLSSLPESRGIAYGEDFVLIDQSYKPEPCIYAPGNEHKD